MPRVKRGTKRTDRRKKSRKRASGYFLTKSKLYQAAQDAVVSAAEDTGREIDLAVRNLVEAGDASARKILAEHRAELEAGVELLIANESLTAEQFAPLRPKGGVGGQVAA